MKRNSLHRKDSKKSLRFLHDAVAKKKKEKRKNQKKKEKRDRIQMDVFTDWPDQLDREGEYYSVYEPGPGICFEIHKSRPFSLVCIRFQSSYDLCQPTFSFSPFSPTVVSGHCNLSPPSCTRYPPPLPPSVFFSILCIVTCTFSLLPIFYPLCPVCAQPLPDRVSTRIIERFPFRDIFGVILLGNRRQMILCFF